MSNKELPAPSMSPSEFELMAVIWHGDSDAKASNSPPAFQLGSLQQMLKAYRERRHVDIGEPKLSTISTCLRSMKDKGLLREVRLLPNGTVEEPPSSAGGLMRSTRSPHTAYKAALSPKEVLSPILRDIVSAYPPEQRKHVLSDLSEHLTDEERIEAFVSFGETLGISEKHIRSIAASAVDKTGE